jgi:hypothetical protein
METTKIVFENRVLKRIFGTKRLEVVGSWRRLRNEELHKLYAPPIIIIIIIMEMKSRMLRWAIHEAGMTGMKSIYLVTVGKSKGKRSLGR